MVERLEKVRYIIVGGALTACFINVVDELNKGSGFGRIIFFSGTLLAFAIILIFFQHKIIISIILYLAGIMMFVSDLHSGPIGRISPAIILFGYSLFLYDNIYYKYITYLSVFIIVTGTHIVKECPPDDLINMLVGYAVLFSLNELIYKKRQSDVKDGG